MKPGIALLLALLAAGCDKAYKAGPAPEQPHSQATAHPSQGRVVVSCGSSAGVGYIRDPDKGDVFEQDGIPDGTTDVVETDGGNFDISYKDTLKTRSAVADDGHVRSIYGKPDDDRFALLEGYSPDEVAILRKFTFRHGQRKGVMVTMVTRDDVVLGTATAKMLVSECIRNMS